MSSLKSLSEHDSSILLACFESSVNRTIQFVDNKKIISRIKMGVLRWAFLCEVFRRLSAVPFAIILCLKLSCSDNLKFCSAVTDGYSMTSRSNEFITLCQAEFYPSTGFLLQFLAELRALILKLMVHVPSD